MTARYGQLTYTSFARAGEPGGWQVKQTRGGLTPDEVDLLVAGVHTGINPVPPLPPYPTPEQVAAFPRRLSYRRFDADTAAYWHVVPAGADSSGRPGNVFAHALLDRQAARTGPRPIQLWGSPGWLTPYGGTAVLAATLSDAAPPVGEEVTAERVTRFVAEPDGRRLAVLGLLLDMVAAALAGGPPAVLGTASSATAAQWIGAVSFLMAPATARRLSFSTFDRAADLAAAPGAGRHLIAVPRADLPDVAAGLAVIDDAAADPPPRPAAAPAWSTLARAALADPAAVPGLLAAIDEASARLAGPADDPGFHPALPMAFTVLCRPAATPAARAVIAAHAPPALRTEPVVAAAVDAELDRRIGVSAADAWRAVTSSTGLLADAAAQVYLHRAIADPDREIVPALLDATTGPDLVARLAGRIGHGTRLLLAERLVAALEVSGEWAGLDPAVLGWLADGVRPPGPAELADARPGDPVWTAATLRGLAALTAGEAAARDRSLALWWLRRHPAAAAGYAFDVGDRPWNPAELLAAVGGGPLPARACTATLVGAPDSAELTALAERVLGANTDPGAVACAVVRAVPPADWPANGYLQTHYRAYTPYWDRVIVETGAAAVHADFAVRFVVIGALAAASGIPPAATCRLLGADPAVAARAARALESTGRGRPPHPTARRWTNRGR